MRKKFIGLAVLLLALTVITVTVYQVGQRQKYQGKAAESGSFPASSCPSGTTLFRYNKSGYDITGACLCADPQLNSDLFEKLNLGYWSQVDSCPLPTSPPPPAKAEVKQSVKGTPYEEAVNCLNGAPYHILGLDRSNKPIEFGNDPSSNYVDVFTVGADYKINRESYVLTMPISRAEALTYLARYHLYVRKDWQFYIRSGTGYHDFNPDVPIYKATAPALWFTSFSLNSYDLYPYIETALYYGFAPSYQWQDPVNIGITNYFGVMYSPFLAQSWQYGFQGVDTEDYNFDKDKVVTAKEPGEEGYVRQSGCRRIEGEWECSYGEGWGYPQIKRGEFLQALYEYGRAKGELSQCSALPKTPVAGAETKLGFKVGANGCNYSKFSSTCTVDVIMTTGSNKVTVVDLTLNYDPASIIVNNIVTSFPTLPVLVEPFFWDQFTGILTARLKVEASQSEGISGTDLPLFTINSQRVQDPAIFSIINANVTAVGVNGNALLETGTFSFPNITSTPISTATPTALPTDSPGSKAGDVNGDGKVNIIDIGILIDNYGLTPPTDVRADLNKDGIVNIIDIGIVIDNYGK